MARADVQAAGLAAIQAADAQAISDNLGVAYDAGATDQKASDGTFTQADIDAAVAAQAASDNAAIVAAQAAQANLQASLDALSAKEAPEAALLQQISAGASALQAALSALLAPPAQS